MEVENIYTVTKAIYSKSLSSNHVKWAEMPPNTQMAISVTVQQQREQADKHLSK